MKFFLLVAGIAGVLLGGLWTVQGLGLVQIEPIACVAVCEAVEGPSPVWVVAGLVVAAVSGFAIWWSLQRRKPPPGAPD